MCFEQRHSCRLFHNYVWPNTNNENNLYLLAQLDCANAFEIWGCELFPWHFFVCRHWCSTRDKWNFANMNYCHHVIFLHFDRWRLSPMTNMLRLFDNTKANTHIKRESTLVTLMRIMYSRMWNMTKASSTSVFSQSLHSQSQYCWTEC